MLRNTMINKGFSFLMLFVRHSPFAATEVDIMSATTQLCTLISLVYSGEEIRNLK